MEQSYRTRPMYFYKDVAKIEMMDEGMKHIAKSKMPKLCKFRAGTSIIKKEITN